MWVDLPKFGMKAQRSQGEAMKFTDFINRSLITVTDEEVVQAEETLDGPEFGTHMRGVVEDVELRKLYAIKLRLDGEVHAAVMEFISATAEVIASDNVPLRMPQNLRDLVNKAEASRKRSEAVNDHFWSSVYEEMEFWGKGKLFLRAGWNVVTKGKECENCGRVHDDSQKLHSTDSDSKSAFVGLGGGFGDFLSNLPGSPIVEVVSLDDLIDIPSFRFRNA